MKKFFLIVLFIFLLGFLLPNPCQMPVQGAGPQDWNPKSFWYEPWGVSGVHKGIDVFAKKGSPVLSASHGLVLYTGYLALGGKVVLVLGPKWRLYYYAHLESINTSPGSFLSVGEPLGQVGDSGNAQGKPPHLHYSLVTLVPYPWRWDDHSQGWKKMFYLDPTTCLGD
ncbi:MAG: M23 family metallopeptidase [Deltaproteobacteria bacterium]|nr:M23 family metallopeptidase [Deltaproteobacteria bacterium]